MTTGRINQVTTKEAKIANRPRAVGSITWKGRHNEHGPHWGVLIRLRVTLDSTRLQSCDRPDMDRDQGVTLGPRPHQSEPASDPLVDIHEAEAHHGMPGSKGSTSE